MKPLYDPVRVRFSWQDLRASGALPGTALALLAALAIGLPLTRGGVPWGAQLAAGLLAALAFGVSRRKGEAVGRMPWIAVALAGGCLATALQLLPLPPTLLGVLSPEAADLHKRILEPIGLYPEWRSVSLDPPATARDLAKGLACLLVLGAAAALSLERRWQQRLAGVLALSGLASAIWALGGAAFTGGSPFAPRTPFANPNHLAALLALTAWPALTLALSARTRGARYSWTGAFALISIAALVSLSRGGIAALAVGGMVFATLGSRGLPSAGSGTRVVATAVFAILGVGAYLGLGPVLDELSTLGRAGGESVRLSIWPVGLRMMGQFPVVGLGRGAFATVFPSQRPEGDSVTFHYLENQWLQVPLDLGLPVGLALLAAVVICWWQAFRRLDPFPAERGAVAGLAALGAQAMVDFSLELLGVAIPAAIALGIATSRSPGPTLSIRAARTWAAALAATVAVAFVVYRAHPTDGDASRVVAAERADRAVPLALAAARWHPADYLPHAAAGAALAREARCAEAMPWLTRAMALAPGRPEPHRDTASCLARAGQHGAAQLEFRLAFLLGAPWDSVRAALNSYSKVDDLLETVPDSPDGLYILGEALRSPRPQEARQVLALAWERYRHPGALEGLAEVNLKLGSPAEAESLAAELQRLRPDWPRGYTLEADARVARGDRPGALASLERGLARMPREMGLIQPYASLLVAERRYEDARRALAGAATHGARQASNLRLAVSDVYRAEKRFIPAIEEARSAAALSPRPEVFAHVASLCESAGKLPDAITALERAVAMGAKHLEPHLGELRERHRKLIEEASRKDAPNP